MLPFATLNVIDLRIDASGQDTQWVALPSLYGVRGLVMPANWTAATISFRGSLSKLNPSDAGNPSPEIRDLRDTSGAISLTVAAASIIEFDRPRFVGITWLAIRSSVAQAQARDFKLITAPAV